MCVLVDVFEECRLLIVVWCVLCVWTMKLCVVFGWVCVMIVFGIVFGNCVRVYVVLSLWCFELVSMGEVIW